MASTLLRSTASAVFIVLLLLCFLLPSTLSQTLSVCYTLTPPADTVYGNWNVQFSAALSVSLYNLPTSYVYTGAANPSYSAVYSIDGITAGTRTFTSATGVQHTSTFGGSSGPLLSVNAVYAPSAITANISNDNLIFVSPSGAWTTSGYGFAFTVTSSGSNANTPGTPGLPGFPTTARYNQATMLKVSSLLGGSLRETGYGLNTIDVNIGTAASYTTSCAPMASNGTGNVTSSTQSSTTVTPTCPAPANTPTFINQPFCYILYPHETTQSGMWSITTSGVFQTSQQSYSVPGSNPGSPTRLAYFIYGVTQVTRTFIDQFGTNTTTSGGFLQGPGGDGGATNLLYTSTNASDPYGGIVRQASNNYGRVLCTVLHFLHCTLAHSFVWRFACAVG